MFLNQITASQKPFKIINLRCNISLTEVNDQHNYGFDPSMDSNFPDFFLIVASKADVNADEHGMLLIQVLTKYINLMAQILIILLSNC